jgi:TPR repeat protein
MIPARAALLIALLVAVAPARAQPADASDVAAPLRGSVAAYRAGDLATAEATLRPLAPGNADAEAWLGAVLLDRGRTREGVQVLQHAAAAGSAEGAHRLALLYAQGADGIPHDDARALELFEKAAAAGHLRAEINAGMLYLYGRGTAKDVMKARAWLEKAAARNDPYALYALGRAMEQSQGAALADPVRAADLYKRAALQGHTFAALRYGLALAEGNGVRKDLVAAQPWLLYAEKYGVPEASLAMGDLAASTANLRDKAGAIKILQTATTWYLTAANAGVAAAQFKLATAYLAGVGVARDPQQALQWYTRAATQGMPVAQHALALFLIGGAAGTPDMVEGYKWLLLAERSGFPDSKAVREKVTDRIAEADRKRAEALANQFKPQPERPLEEMPPKLAPPPSIRP